MVSPLKIASENLPPVVRRKILGSGQRRRVALEPLDGARAQHQHAVRALAAHHLLPGPGDDIELGPRQVHGEDGRGRVADGEALAIVGDPVAVRHLHARGRAVPGEDDVVRPVDGLEIGDLAVARLQDARVLELELLGHVGDPAFAEALPGQHVDGPRARAATTAPSRRRRYPTPARWRCGSRRECQAPRACDRPPRQSSSCRAWNGGTARRRRLRGLPVSIPDVWRRVPTKSRDAPDACSASSISPLQKSCTPVGERGPGPV